MKIILLLGFAYIAFKPVLLFSQTHFKINLHESVQKKSIEVYNRELSLIDEPGHLGIRLSKNYGEGVAWLKDIELSNGTIEFDVRGENVKQNSFVGIAFHGQNDSTFDAIYLRPFQFLEKDETLRKRSIQYISLPQYTWRTLRAQSPGKYENEIVPAPNPDGWVKMKVVINDSIVTTFINGSKTPSLVIQKVTAIKTGRIGFYVADVSGGDFANIKIEKLD